MKALILTAALLIGSLASRAQIIVFDSPRNNVFVPCCKTFLFAISAAKNLNTKLIMPGDTGKSRVTYSAMIPENVPAINGVELMPVAKPQNTDKTMPIVQTDRTGYTMPVVGKTLPKVYTMKKSEGVVTTIDKQP